MFYEQDADYKMMRNHAQQNFVHRHTNLATVASSMATESIVSWNDHIPTDEHMTVHIPLDGATTRSHFYSCGILCCYLTPEAAQCVCATSHTELNMHEHIWDNLLPFKDPHGIICTCSLTSIWHGFQKFYYKRSTFCVNHVSPHEKARNSGLIILQLWSICFFRRGMQEFFIHSTVNTAG